ncbi:MAG: leucine--tRNA ligase [Gammaproteobacteria bacterium RIFCSPHIGHO2_12_FULL_38_11]|nr:MAG: leucine--tRNA ligase [Gammaproteobacteria bacterium RIFCSPHIGHO2_12_FULL_38_11]
MNNDYCPAEIESHAQADWEKSGIFEAKENDTREKFYCLSMLPYPSGELHMGHTRNYTIGDVIARYERMKGKNVLQPMGWDAFGLPAENAAIQRQLPPSVWTRDNIKKMRTQLQQLGLAVDWTREIATCDPTYYRWEQWLFIQLFKKGLAYKKKSLVNWDPIDQTVLANEQVVEGKGWRSGAPVERREISQWFLKITDYAEELLTGLDELTQWPQQVVQMQRNWIGKSEGIEIDFATRDGKLTVFTTRPDTLMGVTYLSIAIEHPLVINAAENNATLNDFIIRYKKTSVAEADIATQEKCGCDTGLFAFHPITQKKIPIWVTNFVLMEYGSGAVMAVPAHDERDHEFAKKYNLIIQPVIKAPEAWDFNASAYTDHGTLINSLMFDGLNDKNAITTINHYLTDKKIGKVRINYRLRDWGISRQRYWGTPIPMVHCDHCGDVPVNEKDLPVILPAHLIPTGAGSPLASCVGFYETNCPTCGKKAKRETDTMDTFMESSWYYARYCSFDQNNSILDERVNYWTPVDQYVGGIEHAVLHLLYARFMHKILRDVGTLNSNEPFKKLLTQGMVLKDGAKMSKSKGNVVAPECIIETQGADTARLFMMFAAPPELSLEWSDAGVEGAYRFLKKIWKLATQLEKTVAIKEIPPGPPFSKGGDVNLSFSKGGDVNLSFSKGGDVGLSFSKGGSTLQKQYREMHLILQQANLDMERQQFNTVVSACMKLLNLLQEIDITNELNKQFLYEGYGILLRLLAPITPHITHYLWQVLGYGKNIMASSWPVVNVSALETDQLDMIIQVNGKLRGKISVSINQGEASIQSQALAEKTIQPFILNKKIKRVIIVPKKLINIVAL